MACFILIFVWPLSWVWKTLTRSPVLSQFPAKKGLSAPAFSPWFSFPFGFLSFPSLIWMPEFIYLVKGKLESKHPSVPFGPQNSVLAGPHHLPGPSKWWVKSVSAGVSAWNIFPPTHGQDKKTPNWNKIKSSLPSLAYLNFQIQKERNFNVVSECVGI